MHFSFYFYPYSRLQYSRDNKCIGDTYRYLPCVYYNVIKAVSIDYTWSSTNSKYMNYLELALRANAAFVYMTKRINVFVSDPFRHFNDSNLEIKIFCEFEDNIIGKLIVYQ